jgi:hypothetical protein
VLIEGTQKAVVVSDMLWHKGEEKDLEVQTTLNCLKVSILLEAWLDQTFRLETYLVSACP